MYCNTSRNRVKYWKQQIQSDLDLRMLELPLSTAPVSAPAVRRAQRQGVCFVCCRKTDPITLAQWNRQRIQLSDRQFFRNVAACSADGRDRIRSKISCAFFSFLFMKTSDAMSGFFRFFRRCPPCPDAAPRPQDRTQRHTEKTASPPVV